MITYGELTAGLGKQTTDFGVAFERLLTLRAELRKCEDRLEKLAEMRASRDLASGRKVKARFN